MCWSAEADLVAGAAVTAVGVACLARTRRARDVPLAALPLLLGAHQLTEAAVGASGGGTGPATLAWAVVALPLLPVWVPAGVLCVAPPHARLRLTPLLAAGTATAAALAVALARNPVAADIRGHTVGYSVDLPHARLVVAGYLAATLGSLLLSGGRGLRLLGVVLGAGALLCWWLWRLEFVSTWCAVAAVCSAGLFGWVHGRAAPPARTRPLAP